jgi:hypothetical protein
VELLDDELDRRPASKIVVLIDTGTDSIVETIADAESAFYENPHGFEGKRYIGDPLHTLNLRTCYDFREGRLKGLSVGIGMRTRLGRVAGARSEYEFTNGSTFRTATTAAW